ncbi:MAG TPA: sec-independent translocase [Aeromicrobium sp.]|nr:sec-independent translocase [Aeromicrobium sp.]
MGWPEMALIAVVGVLVFGPDKLPDFARQAAQFTKTLRKMAQDAKNDIGREFGRDLTDTGWKDIDPREVVRRTILEEDDAPRPTPRPAPQRSLKPGERPPLDPDAT